MSDHKIHYGTKAVVPGAVCELQSVKPRIPYVGAIMDFLTLPFIWYPLWIVAAVAAYKVFA